MPRVSTIIPTYNRADILDRAIDSVLGQTFEDLELIVVDDGSTDDTAELIAEYDDPRLTFIEHDENRGGSVARNTGIEHASGDYFAFLDSDDAWRPRKLELQVAELDRRSDDWVAVYCDAEFVTADTSLVQQAASLFVDYLGGPDAPTEGGEELIKHVLADELHTSAGSTLLVRQETVDAIDGFDESFIRFQDPEFLIRILRQGKLAYIDETLVERYESAEPPPNLVAAADRHYLDTYWDTVKQLEDEGYNVIAVHRLAVARVYFHEGRFRDGLHYLTDAHFPRVHQLPGLAYSVMNGIRQRTLPR